MRIPALSLALLAVALSGSANGKPEAADPPTAAHRPTYLAADNALTAFRQDTLAPSPTMDLIRRQIISSVPSPAPDLPVLTNTDCDAKCKTDCAKDPQSSPNCLLDCYNKCKKGGTSSGTRASYETGKV